MSENQAPSHPLKQTLLLADQDPLLQKVFKDHYSLSYRLLITSSGKEAYELAINDQIDMAVLNIQTTDISGFDTCTHLKQHPVSADIPVILIGATPSPAQITFGLNLGAIDFISTPVDISILTAKIKNHMQLAAKLSALALISCTDGLTGVPNRMQLDTSLNRAWYAAIRGHHHLSLLMIDIDYFKRFNDTFGHVAGDECLKRVAQTIQNALHRDSDSMGRYGGEEFAVVLPFTDLQGAKLIGQHILEEIERLDIDNPKAKTTKKVTVSIGVATLDPAQEIDYTHAQPEDLIKRADKTLYRAKKQGRNTIVAER
ncbi:MAG: diguanylate cyclase (GGDEF)-like protein [Paraglaciecola sp.]|jgi:diguanylate cyclase (GGDEF)-like protein